MLIAEGLLTKTSQYSYWLMWLQAYNWKSKMHKAAQQETCERVRVSLHFVWCGFQNKQFVADYHVLYVFKGSFYSSENSLWAFEKGLVYIKLIWMKIWREKYIQRYYYYYYY